VVAALAITARYIMTNGSQCPPSSVLDYIKPLSVVQNITCTTAMKMT